VLKPPVITERNDWLKALQHSASVSDQDWWTTFWLSLFLGMFGADRFYLGQVGLGLFKFLTMGGGMLWWIGDFLWLMSGNMRDGEGKIVKRPPQRIRTASERADKSAMSARDNKCRN